MLWNSFSARGGPLGGALVSGKQVVLDGSEVGRAAMDVPGLLREILKERRPLPVDL